MFHRLGLIHRNQRGFTLLELLIAFAITGVVAGAATTTIFQMFYSSVRSSNYMTVVRQVQNAGYWVSRDAQMAQSVVITGVSGFPLTLTWTDWESGDVHEVEYSLLLDNKLQRHYTCALLGLDETGIQAQYLDPAETKYEFAAGSAFSLPDTGDVFTIRDAVGGDSGTITVTAGNIDVTTTGGATYIPGTGAWTTLTAGGTVVVTANSPNKTGSWTATTGTATAAITVDGGNATLTDGGMLILTVTATVGSGSQEESETRVYKVISRPNS